MPDLERRADAPGRGASSVLLLRPDARLRWEVLEDHFGDACFLTSQWERALVSPRYTLTEVARGHERRLRAHLDGLEAGGPEVDVRLLLPALDEEDGEKVRVAASVLLRRADGEGVASVLALLHQGGESRRAATRALGLSDRPGLAVHLSRVLEAREVGPEEVAAAVEALCVRCDSPGPLRLARLLAHPAHEVRRAALWAARRWPGEVEANEVCLGLASSVPGLRAAALEAGLVSGQLAAWRACRDMAEAPDAAGCTARLLLALGGDTDDVARLVELLEVPVLRGDTLWALGFSGWKVAAEACLPWLGDSRLGCLAAEAFCAITGLKLEKRYARLPTTDAASLPLDEGLPLPEAAEVERWWTEARGDFDAQTRYLGGQPATAARLLYALEAASMRRRSVLALELAIRTGGAHVVETRTWACVQHRQLAAARAWQGGSTLRPFVTWMRC